MKITIKLNKEEATAYSNMKKSLVPEGVNDDVFVRNVFFMGLEQFHRNTMEMMQKYVSENEEKLRAEGVDVDSIFDISKGNITEVAEDEAPVENVSEAEAPVETENNDQ